MFLLSDPPQFLNQAPPGAQQLTRPDFLNVPHFGHTIALAIVEVIAATDGVTGVRTINSRSGIGRRVASRGVVCVHTVRDIDPGDLSNINSLLAFEWTQATPQSVCLNDLASRNI